jgi:hypothetical protein
MEGRHHASGQQATGGPVREAADQTKMSTALAFFSRNLKAEAGA